MFGDEGQQPVVVRLTRAQHVQVTCPGWRASLAVMHMPFGYVGAVPVRGRHYPCRGTVLISPPDISSQLPPVSAWLSPPSQSPAPA